MSPDSSGMEQEGLLHNRVYFEEKMNEGYRIIDYGPDFARRSIRGGPARNYQMERMITKNYLGYQKGFIRTGKNSLYIRGK